MFDHQEFQWQAFGVHLFLSFQPTITVGNPYPQQNIPVGTNSSSGSYTHVPEEIEDDFNWEKLL